MLAEGAKSERAYAKDGTIPAPTSTDNPEFQIVLAMIRDGLKKNPTKWTKYAEALQGTPHPPIVQYYGPQCFIYALLERKPWELLPEGNS